MNRNKHESFLVLPMCSGRNGKNDLHARASLCCSDLSLSLPFPSLPFPFPLLPSRARCIVCGGEGDVHLLASSVVCPRAPLFAA
jgi:hypothetical protein